MELFKARLNYKSLKTKQTSEDLKEKPAVVLYKLFFTAYKNYELSIYIHFQIGNTLYCFNTFYFNRKLISATLRQSLQAPWRWHLTGGTLLRYYYYFVALVDFYANYLNANNILMYLPNLLKFDVYVGGTQSTYLRP